MKRVNAGHLAKIKTIFAEKKHFDAISAKEDLKYKCIIDAETAYIILAMAAVWIMLKLNLEISAPLVLISLLFIFPLFLFFRFIVYGKQMKKLKGAVEAAKKKYKESLPLPDGENSAKNPHDDYKKYIEKDFPPITVTEDTRRCSRLVAMAPSTYTGLKWFLNGRNPDEAAKEIAAEVEADNEKERGRDDD